MWGKAFISIRDGYISIRDGYISIRNCAQTSQSHQSRYRSRRYWLQSCPGSSTLRWSAQSPSSSDPYTLASWTQSPEKWGVPTKIYEIMPYYYWHLPQVGLEYPGRAESSRRLYCIPRDHRAQYHWRCWWTPRSRRLLLYYDSWWV